MTGCHNNDANKTIRFFSVPENEARKALWIYATGKQLSTKNKFYVCSDHFDVRPRNLLKVFPYILCFIVGGGR